MNGERVKFTKNVTCYPVTITIGASILQNPQKIVQ